MKFLKTIRAWWRGLFRKRRFNMLNATDNTEEWHMHLSPASILAGLVAFMLMLFILTLSLVAYSPILEFLPGYRTEADRFGGRIAVDFVFQELDYLPEGLAVPEGRVKPWGTNHAVMMAADAVHEPFAVINADDFYGAEAYKTIGDYLAQLGESRNSYCMVAYDLNKTLSENGTVSRGVCGVDPKGDLTSMVERTQIERMPDGRIVFHDNGADEPLAEDTPVSMNLFGFTPDFFTYSKEYFKVWFEANKDNIKSEFYIPTMVNKLIGDGTATLRVLRSAAQWHGVTYKEDKPALMASIEKMIAEGKYPRNLWA